MGAAENTRRLFLAVDPSAETALERAMLRK
jgi:hypothetical protein